MSGSRQLPAAKPTHATADLLTAVISALLEVLPLACAERKGVTGRNLRMTNLLEFFDRVQIGIAPGVVWHRKGDTVHVASYPASHPETLTLEINVLVAFVCESSSVERPVSTKEDY